MRHLIFFDAQCPWCWKAVKHVLEIDKEKRFVFAPLGGETAHRILTGPLGHYRKENSLVLVEDYQSTEREFWIRSQAMLRVYWLVGDGWKLIGWLSLLPGWVGDWLYKWFAEHRHQFKLKPIKEINAPERFLP